MVYRRCGVLVICMVLILTGCASYKGQPLSAASPLRFGATTNHVSLRLEPLTGEQAKTAFDANSEEIRILFVRALLQNQGEEPYVVSRHQMRLLTKQGIVLTPISPSRVARKMRSTHDGLAVGSVFLFGIFSYPSFQSASEATDAMVKDLTEKGLPEEVTLASRMTAAGVLYFELPTYVTSHDGVRMEAVLRPGAGGEPLHIQVPLSEGAKEDKR
jgi:hypothetical protein